MVLTPCTSDLLLVGGKGGREIGSSLTLTTLTEEMMSDVTEKVNQGRARIDVRKNGKYRVRFNCVHDDQLELILAALDTARAEAETRYDAVALTGICMHFLANY